MATSYKTPGVYVEEIPKLPPSVAQVETAIPAFIGYTEKAEKNGENILNIPTEVSSLIEFETWFGGAYAYQPGDIEVRLNEANNFAVSEVVYTDKVFYLYEAMRLFYDNGGGKCYVVSVGLYAEDNFTNGVLDSSAALDEGLDAVEKYDEPTILVIPDAVSLTESEFYALQQAAISQCAKLQDRVAVFDLNENGTDELDEAIDEFRDNIGITNLKYAAAYAPWLLTSYPRTVDFELFRNNVTNNDGTVTIDLTTDLSTDANLNTLVVTAASATDDLEQITTDIEALQGTAGSLSDRYNALRGAVLLADEATTVARFQDLMTFIRDLALTFPDWRTGAAAFINTDLRNALDSAAIDPTAGLRKFVVDLVAMEKNADVDALLTAHNYVSYNSIPVAAPDSWLGQDIAAITASTTNYGTPGTPAGDRAVAVAALSTSTPGAVNVDNIFKGLNDFVTKITLAASTYKKLSQDALFANHPVIANIVRTIKKLMSKVPPSGAVAGIYARVDSGRGVWKAPANETVFNVTAPAYQITAEDQSDMNVDPVAGKSINAIRSFTGKGTLVWGARTLAGNDNEWRYISVRRFFNMVEESCKKSTEPFVFEPNDANTWVRLQGMIENFLTTLWRQGALQGAKPEHAFYVSVGLGKTMTALDILEGRMIVEIGMAVVRPAEFIILRFSHKMAES
jgi:phage tail sheath protein FI